MLVHAGKQEILDVRGAEGQANIGKDGWKRIFFFGDSRSLCVRTGWEQYS